jgi:hypothetical protein
MFRVTSAPVAFTTLKDAMSALNGFGNISDPEQLRTLLLGVR